MIMEQRQIDYITKFFTNLISLTRCNSKIYASLFAEKVLSLQDIETLEAKRNNEGATAESFALYLNLFRKTGAYDVLITALDNDDPKNGAKDILVDGLQRNFDTNAITTARKIRFIEGPPRFAEFANGQGGLRVLVVSSADIGITTERIQTTNMPHKLVPYMTPVGDADDNLFQTICSAHVTVVIAVYGKRMALQRVLNTVQNFSENGTNKNVVVVSTESISSVEQLLPSRQFQTVSDEVKWTALVSEFQSVLLEKSVSFQGAAVQLKSLCQDTTLLEKLESHILIQLMNSDDSADEMPILCKNTIRPTPEYYIKRKMIPRKIINGDILEKVMKAGNTSLAITGIKRGKLLEMDSTSKTCEEQIRTKGPMTAKLIFLKHDKDDNPHTNFQRLCKKISQWDVENDETSEIKNLHWLNFNGVNYEWIKSFGSTLLLQDFVDVDPEKNKALSEEDLVGTLTASDVSSNNSIPDAICISDSPGMGKTTLMTHFGQQLVANRPTDFTQYFAMTELMQAFEDKEFSPRKLTKVDIFDVLLSKFSNSALTDHLFLNGSNISLMLDGFDEILPHHEELGKKMIQILRHDTRNKIRLWITTRPVQLPVVEELLGVLGWNMLPFNDADQQNFILSYWKMLARQKQITLNDAKLETFCRGSLEILSNFSKKMTTFEKGMSALPLQLLLLAQVCTGAMFYDCSEGDIGEEDAPEKVVIKNIADLYNSVVNKKLEILLNRESSNSHILSHLAKNNKKTMKLVHMKYAIQLLLPEWSDKFDIVFLHESDIDPKELSIYGFVEGVSAKTPLFVHRTYAEYFLALFVVEIGMCDRFLQGFNITDSVAEFFIKNVLSVRPTRSQDRDFMLSAFQMPVVVYFINSILEDKKCHISPNLLNAFSQHWDEINKDIPFDSSGSTYIATVIGDRFQIMQLLLACMNLEQEVEIESKQNIFLQKSADYHKNLILSAACFGVSKEMFEELCDLVEKWNSQKVTEFSYTATQNPVQFAVLAGNLEVVNYLIHVKQLPVSIWDEENGEILHKCVSQTMYKSDKEIDDRQEIIFMLVEKSKGILEHRNSQGATPLLQDDVHPKLRITLLEAGADTNAANDDSFNVLHMLQDFYKITPQDYHYLVKMLVSKDYVVTNKCGGFSMGRTYTPNWDFTDDTPLHLAVGHFEVLEETIDLFISEGLRLDEVNGYDFTILHIAVKFGRSLPFVKMIMQKLEEKEMDWNMKNMEGTSIIHEAAQTGNLELLQYLLDEYDEEIDMCDDDNNNRNGLHYAFRAKQNRLEIIQLFLDKDEDSEAITAVSTEDSTPIVEGFYTRDGVDLKILEYIQQKIPEVFLTQVTDILLALYDVTTEEIDNNFNCLATAKWLIDQGANITQLYPYKNSTLLHKASKSGWLSGMKLLFEKRSRSTYKDMVTVTATDNDSSTPLYSAISSGDSHQNLEVIKFLLKKGALVNEPCGKRGMKPIHAAAQSGWEDCIELLLKTGANVHNVDDDGNTAIHYAYTTSGLCKQIEAFLVENGADPNVRNNSGQTPEKYGDEFGGNYNEEV